MLSRRDFLKASSALAVALMGGLYFTRKTKINAKHILCSASHDKLAVSLSLPKGISQLELKVNNLTFNGRRVDLEGKHWQILADKLDSLTTYQLKLLSGDEVIDSPWPLRTLPNPESDIDKLSIMAFTCAGGSDGFSVSGKQFFKPFAFRQRMFDEGLAQNPDLAIAIGDHVYFDLRRESSPPVGRNNKFIKFFVGGLLKLRYGSFDRKASAKSKQNERVLKKIGNEQIADLYGTKFRSIPTYFIADDHDYFENDDAEEELVTFPADDFSRDAFKTMADLYYPPMIDTSSGKLGRKNGSIRYGKLFEALMADCAGDMTLGGDKAGLVSTLTEKTLIKRFKKSKAKHLAFVPSHPLGYTAGKWREWYPDVVATEGETGTVANELLSEKTFGSLTVEATKYLWQSGWFLQHQRLLSALSNRPGSRFMLSGDIHAIAVSSIKESSGNNLPKPVKSILVVPVSSSTGTWPSAARGIVAAKPNFLEADEIVPVTEENGFVIMNIDSNSAVIKMNFCGGHDPQKGDDGSIRRTFEFEV